MLVRAATSAAPAPRPEGPPGSPAAGGPPRGDQDGDHVSDEFAGRLRPAGPWETVAVIVRGLSAEESSAGVGPFRVTRRLPLIDGFSASMTAAQARALARHPGVFRVDQDGQVRALDDATDSDYGATAAGPIGLVWTGAAWASASSTPGWTRRTSRLRRAR